MYADLVNGEVGRRQRYDFRASRPTRDSKPTLKLRTDTTGQPLFRGGHGRQLPWRHPDRVSRRLQPRRLRLVPAQRQPRPGRHHHRHPPPAAPSRSPATATPRRLSRSTPPRRSCRPLCAPLKGPFAAATVAGFCGRPIHGDAVEQRRRAHRPADRERRFPDRRHRPGCGRGAVPDTDPSPCHRRRLDSAPYGVGMDITIKVSDQASLRGRAGATRSAFQENLVLLLVEAYYGFVCSDNAPKAFVACHRRPPDPRNDEDREARPRPS